MLSPDDIGGWQGREFFAIDATKMLRAALGNTAPAVICKGVVPRSPGTLFPLWFPQPHGRPIDTRGYWQPDHGALAELVSRVTEMRSRRWNAETQILARWPKNWEALITKAYPAWRMPFACSEGWADLIAAGAAWIHEIEPETDWQIDDAKEKFGRLSLYWSGDLDDPATEVLDCMEHLSAHVCEVCGGPGEVRKGGWLQCLCDEHDRERTWRDWVR